MIKVLYQDGKVRLVQNGGVKVLVEESAPQNQVLPQLYYDPGNISCYPGSGNTISNIGTLGNVSGTAGTLSSVTYKQQTAGGVFDFSGSGISFGQFNFGSAITVSVWIYPRNNYSINTLMSNASAGLATNGFKLGWNRWETTDLKIIIEAGNGSAGSVAETPAAIVENEWQHLTWAIDFSGTNVDIYRNGELLSKTGNMVPNIGTNNPSWYIGAMSGAYYMKADMGEFKLWKSIKTAPEISDDFNNTKSRYGL